MSKYGEQQLTVLAGKITVVGDDSITLESTARIRLGLEIESEKLTLGTRVLVRARRMRGEYIAESIVVGKRPSVRNLSTWLLLTLGWYLLAPPIRGDYSHNTSAPLREWYHGGAFDTAAACEAERQSWVRDATEIARASPREGEAGQMSLGLLKGALLSICIASDDPRLNSGPPPP